MTPTPVADAEAPVVPVSKSNLKQPPPYPRLRAYIVGVPLLLGVCLLSVYADMVSKVVQFGVLQFAPPALAALFIIAGLNTFLKKFTSRTFLSSADLVAIYAMMLTGVLVSTRGVVEKLVVPLAYLPYFATRENGWNASLTQHLPKWAVPFVPSAQAGPPPEVISEFWEGVAPGHSIPWSAWVGPICAWFALIGSVIWVFLCLSALLRRQWMDNEQLRFPLTTLPLAVIRDDVEGQPFWSNKTMWAGFVFAFLVFFENGLNSNFPDFPKIVTDLNFGPYFSDRPWNQMDYTVMYLSLAAIGFLYFLPVEMLFSLWFFFVVARLQDVGATLFGGVPQGIATHNARVFTGYQAAGAYFVLIGAQIRIGWPHFKAAWRTAFGPKDKRPLDDSGEMLSYRTAFLGLFFGFAFIIGWLTFAGMNPWLAIMQMGLYIFFIAIIMARGVAEAGFLMTETSFLPSHVISLLTPLAGFGAPSLTMMGAANAVFCRDQRGGLLSSFMDNQKIMRDLGIKPRRMLLPLGGSVVFAMVVSTIFFLYLHYTQGGLALYGYPKQNANQMFSLADAQIKGSGYQPDATAYGGIVVGIIVTLALTWARAQFTWFPLHPLAYAIAPTWAMIVLWFPCLVAWALKAGTLRFGGVETYRKIAPFMLGLIGGEFCAAVFWALGNMLRGWSTPNFPWP
ncbi:hypothetical protein IAD21_03756 [Abditibacteriota bacterium]|nr:hypothetical protein IAD21_03756 [Abditibacteriota bacterium]